MVAAARHEFADKGWDAAAAVEHIVDDQQPVLGVQRVDQITERKDLHLRVLLVDAFIGGGADRDMVAVMAVIVEQFLHRDPDRRAAEPDADEVGRSEEQTSELQDLMRTSYGVLC